MASADDSINNKLVIDENGYAKLINNPRLGHLYPVSQETWCAGNRYVGKHSSLSDAKPSYESCLLAWLDFLQKEKPVYISNYTTLDDESKIMKEIKQYYIRNSVTGVG